MKGNSIHYRMRGPLRTTGHWIESADYDVLTLEWYNFYTDAVRVRPAEVGRK
jgi:hypothetical protein